MPSMWGHLLGAIYDQFTAVELALIILLFINECFFFFKKRKVSVFGVTWARLTILRNPQGQRIFYVPRFLAFIDRKIGAWGFPNSWCVSVSVLATVQSSRWWRFSNSMGPWRRIRFSSKIGILAGSKIFEKFVLSNVNFSTNPSEKRDQNPQRLRFQMCPKFWRLYIWSSLVTKRSRTSHRLSSRIWPSPQPKILGVFLCISDTDFCHRYILKHTEVLNYWFYSAMHP